MSQDGSKRSPTMKELDEGWKRISKQWILIRDKQTGEKFVLRQTEGLCYMVGSRNRAKYEVEKIFITDEEIAIAEILYGQQPKKD